MRIVAGAAALGLTASLLSTVEASAAPSGYRNELASPACRSALTALAAAQQTAAAPSALIARSLRSCSDGPRVLPKAQFAVVTDLDADRQVPVGLVFSWTDVHTMSAGNQGAATYLLANGTGVKNPVSQPATLIRNHKASLRFGGRTYAGEVNVAGGATSQLVVFSFAKPVGTVSKPEAHLASVVPVKGAKVVVYGDSGPVDAAVGPTFGTREFSLDRRAFGVVTAPDGTYRGTSRAYAKRNPTAKARAFWATRAVFEPYQGISDNAIG